MHRVKEWFYDFWQELATTIGLILCLIIYYWYKLISIPSGHSPSEFAIRHNLSSNIYGFTYLTHHAVNLPYNFLLFVFQELGLKTLFDIRAVGAILGILTACLFFYIVKRFFSRLVAALSSLILVTSLWFLQASRNGSALGLSLLLIVVLVFLSFLIRSNMHRHLKSILAVLVLCLLVYIPGAFWLIVIGLIFERKIILKDLRNLTVLMQIMLALLCLVLLSPLILSIYHDHSTFLSVLGLPQHISLKPVLHNILKLPEDLFIYNVSSNYFSIAHLPIINIFCDISIALGIYWLWLHEKYETLYEILAVFIVGWILFSLGNLYAYLILLPMLYLLVAVGINYLLSLWFGVFPYNPVARFAGIAAISLCVLSVCWFNINQYFIVWPNTPNITQTYPTKIPG